LQAPTVIRKKKRKKGGLCYSLFQELLAMQGCGSSRIFFASASSSS